MTDDEFLNDRDCTPKPQGDTPRTDAQASYIHYFRAPSLHYVPVEFARELERELARARRVVNAAQRHAINGDSGANLFWHVTEWEAGR